MSLEIAEKKVKQAHVWSRDDKDWYVEPERVTKQLLAVERFVGGVWDPACGKGNIVKPMLRHGLPAVGTDVVARFPPGEWPDWFGGLYDFLNDPEDAIEIALPHIVCNPPFYRAKGAEAFCRRALQLAQGKVAMFLDIKFLAGGRRGRGLYEELPPSRVWILSDRPSCPPGELLEAGGEAAGGTADWCWVVWDKTVNASGTHIGWLTTESK